MPAQHQDVQSNPKKRCPQQVNNGINPDLGSEETPVQTVLNTLTTLLQGTVGKIKTTQFALLNDTKAIASVAPELAKIREKIHEKAQEALKTIKKDKHQDILFLNKVILITKRNHAQLFSALHTLLETSKGISAQPNIKLGDRLKKAQRCYDYLKSSYCSFSIKGTSKPTTAGESKTQTLDTREAPTPRSVARQQQKVTLMGWLQKSVSKRRADANSQSGKPRRIESPSSSLRRKKPFSTRSLWKRLTYR